MLCNYCKKPILEIKKRTGPKRKFCCKRCADCSRSEHQRKTSRGSKLCAECNVTFERGIFDKRQKYCSAKCSNRNGWRRTEHSRRARSRGVMSEPVDPLAVFQRDGWRCQLCGAATPQRLRGKMDGRAPELDHIVPLAAGGDHSYRNTQCACRACNNAKAGDWMFEPFSGSGTSIIACEKMNMNCAAMELAPEYTDIAIRRWQDFTGLKATLQGTDKTWEDVANDRYDFRKDGLGSWEEWCAAKRKETTDARAQATP